MAWSYQVFQLVNAFFLLDLRIVANLSFPAQAQEQDALSDADFESDDEDLNGPAENSEDEESDDEDGRPPAKKQRSA